MAKKRQVRKTATSASPKRSDSTADPVESAAAAVKQARATLDQAIETYDQARVAAAEKVTEARAITIGELIDGTLTFARRHPAFSLFTAGLIGFLLGRIRNR